jgi:hypothetical protein
MLLPDEDGAGDGDVERNGGRRSVEPSESAEQTAAGIEKKSSSTSHPQSSAVAGSINTAALNSFFLAFDGRWSLAKGGQIFRQPSCWEGVGDNKRSGKGGGKRNLPTREFIAIFSLAGARRHFFDWLIRLEANK